MDILIKNGRVADGGGQALFDASVLVRDDRIVRVGAGDENLKADRVIDAAGCIIAPGFIDTHSHSDLRVLVEPEVLPKVMQGITTEILGQDGVSLAPLPRQYVAAWRKNLAGLEGDSDDISWDYPTAEKYLAALEEAKPGLNECYLVPHGNVRMEAMGLDNRAPGPEEMARMRDIVRRDMEAGAFGLSSGLIYLPCLYSKDDELAGLCAEAEKFEGVFVVHQRSEADAILDSMKEIIGIGKRAGIRTHWSHFKLCGKNNADKFEAQIKLFEDAKKDGLRVSFDQYPYVAGSTMLGVILPPWVHDGGTDKLLSRLESPEMRKKIVADMERGIPGWDNFINFAGLDGIFITSVKNEKNRRAIGMNLVQLGEARGRDPYNATFDLLYEEENAVGMVDFYGLEEHVIYFLRMEEQNVCTDGLLGGKPHPRVYGAFPRVLGKYCREEKALGIEAAVRKMTGRPAEVFQIKDRGFIKEGYFADICVFNPDTIIDKGDYQEPARYPEGIEYVIINGEVVVEKGRHTGKRAGRVLRKNGS
ncbi:MAG: D-aminoacylase [Spirochaetales bacterium]|jgi:N-acyl-D-amino-acid deacylase|nr:D-aminoacylase [Spirochaetales bacterium]